MTRHQTPNSTDLEAKVAERMHLSAMTIGRLRSSRHIPPNIDEAPVRGLRVTGLIGAVCMLLTGAAQADQPTTWVMAASQPANVGDAAIAARAYHASGAYGAGLKRVADEATAWIAKRAPEVGKPALVLDIDETALSNWSIIKRDDFGRPIVGGCDLALDAPCGWAAWDQLGRDPAIEPTLGLFTAAKKARVAIFFITGRPASQRVATAYNLNGVGYDGFAELVMVPAGKTFASAADFKTPVRARIERDGFTIIANVGDQPSDLIGGHAERSFLLPDPFYRVP